MNNAAPNKIKAILGRYKLSYQELNDGEFRIGSRHHLGLFMLYYFYIPLVIGSSIVVFGFIVDFEILGLCGAPFLVYCLYGLFKVKQAKNENLNVLYIINNELSLSRNGSKIVFRMENIQSITIESDSIDRERFYGKLILTDIENQKHVILYLIDDQSSLIDNLNYLKEFILSKLKIEIS